MTQTVTSTVSSFSAASPGAHSLATASAPAARTFFHRRRPLRRKVVLNKPAPGAATQITKRIAARSTSLRVVIGIPDFNNPKRFAPLANFH
jgi:hypothetical protein